MSVTPQSSVERRQMHETYNTILANIEDEANRRDGDFMENAQTIATEFIRGQVGDDRRILAYIIDQSEQGPHFKYRDYDFDMGDGMGALKALAASALVYDVTAR